MRRRIVKSFVIQEDGTIVHIRGDTAMFSMKADLDGMPVDSYSAVLSVKQYPDDTDYLLQRCLATVLLVSLSMMILST
jgi:hypothetical protein